MKIRNFPIKCMFSGKMFHRNQNVLQCLFRLNKIQLTQGIAERMAGAAVLRHVIFPLPSWRVPFTVLEPLEEFFFTTKKSAETFVFSWNSRFSGFPLKWNFSFCCSPIGNIRIWAQLSSCSLLCLKIKISP